MNITNLEIKNASKSESLSPYDTTSGKFHIWSPMRGYDENIIENYFHAVCVKAYVETNGNSCL